MMRALLIVLACAATAQAQTGPGVVGEVRVHGNHTTPDDRVMAIIGDVVGRPATDALVAEVADKLDKSGQFDSVDVRKRFRSIDNPDDILLMIVVDEFPGIDPIDGYQPPSPVKRFWTSGMFLPILHSEDGYGFTYGGRLSFVDRFGPRSRVSIPLSWGGERQARLQAERSFRSGPIERVFAEAGIGRRENPHYEIGDTRTSFSARAESAVQRWLRVGGGGGVDDVSFGDLTDTIKRIGADVTLDTRVDPAFPRNAVHATFGIERLDFDATSANRRTADVRGYVGLFRGTVLALRGVSVTSTAALPPYEHNLLGGAANLRGYDAGFEANDNLAAASAEIRIPLTSPLSIGRFGVKAFVDFGTAYPFGEKLEDQAGFNRGIGGGAYLHLTIVNVSLDVARSREGDTRFHFSLGVTFK
ncbi:MAG TPA: BamA/TamA family outer membrane protein [Vicinamibacterales bacterium]|nr:BamA/TamA family outer membrane protein [Vicinamibacterales bacterium]